MSFRDYITSAMADGHMSQDAGTEYIARYDELAEDIGGQDRRKPPPNALLCRWLIPDARDERNSIWCK